jgi:hypothetical protein
LDMRTTYLLVCDHKYIVTVSQARTSHLTSISRQPQSFEFSCDMERAHRVGRGMFR